MATQQTNPPTGGGTMVTKDQIRSEWNKVLDQDIQSGTVTPENIKHLQSHCNQLFDGLYNRLQSTGAGGGR